AGGIAHDFNNLLAAILTYSEFIATELEPDHPVQADVAEVRKAAKRAAELTRQLLVFSRRDLVKPSVLDVNDSITDLLNLLRRTIGEDIELNAELAPDLPRVLADPGELEQVLMNLAVNARDAMPDGGRLTIETANVTLSSSEAQELALPAGEYVTLAVHDTGCGMDEATAARIFDPFFTTKGVGKGTGLGLSTAFGIVQGHLGAIAVTTAPGRGSTFRVHVPRVAGRAASAPSGSSPPPSPGTETILVVDDDPGVRNAARRALVRAGYAVLEARNAHAALDVLHDRGHEVAAVLTDVVMPHVDGPTMVRQAHERFPHLRILYMSGYSEHESVKVPLAEGDRFLAKPFETAELLAAIRQVIDGASVAA
ncbi:MAG TPA: ATP-binding protein, partial [Polyangiaceae bacterium]